MPEQRPKFSRPIKVIFADLDGMRHVNHAVMLSYCEAARTEYWQKVTGISRIDDFDFILAELTVRYHAPASLGDDLVVACQVTEMRRSSFIIEHEVRNQHSGQLIAEVRSVQVMYDYAAGKTIAISDERRRQVEAFEQRTLSAPRP